MDLASSSIWDGATGFGGDGEKSLPKTVGGGSCVTDGPFAHLRPIMYADTYEPHCLSRGFNFNGTAGRLPSEPFSPETIGPLTRLEPFENFASQVEWYLHGKLHDSVGGDFPQITAANGKYDLFIANEAALCTNDQSFRSDLLRSPCTA